MQTVVEYITEKEAAGLGYAVCPNRICGSVEVELIRHFIKKRRLTKSINTAVRTGLFFCTWCGMEFEATIK